VVLPVFVEVMGHATDRNLVTAFEDVKRIAKFFKSSARTRPDEAARRLRSWGKLALMRIGALVSR